MALAHFAAGVSGTLLILLVTGWYKHHLAPHATFVGGFWGVLPDIHHIVSDEYITELIQLVHRHPVADIFFLHYTMDVYDSSNSKWVTFGCLVLMVLLLCAFAYARHRKLSDNPCYLNG